MTQAMKKGDHTNRLPRVMAKRHNPKWGTQPPKAVSLEYAFWIQESRLSLAD